MFLRTGRISGPEVGDGAKPDVPTTDRQNEKKHLVFYEASMHARRCVINMWYEVICEEVLLGAKQIM